MKIVMIILILYFGLLLLMPMYIRNHVSKTSLLRGYSVRCIFASLALVFAIMFSIFSIYSTVFAKEKIDILAFINGENQILQISTVALFTILAFSILFCIIHIVLHSRYLRAHRIPTLSSIAMHFFLSITCYVSLPIITGYLLISGLISKTQERKRKKLVKQHFLLPLIKYTNKQRNLNEDKSGSEVEKKAV